MADINQVRFAPLLWPTTPHPAIKANDNKDYKNPKERAYRNPRHEPQDENVPDRDKHIDEYA